MDKNLRIDLFMGNSFIKLKSVHDEISVMSYAKYSTVTVSGMERKSVAIMYSRAMSSTD